MTDKYTLEFEKKREAGLIAGKTGKYDKSDLYEMFNNNGDRDEKIKALKEIAGKSQSVIAPTKGNPYKSGLSSDDVVRDAYFGEIDGLEVKALKKGVIDEGGKYWISLNNDDVLIHYREVSKELYDFVKENRGLKNDIPIDSGLEFGYEAGFGEGLTISGNRNNYVVVPVPGSLDSNDYFSVKFDLLEKMVRIGRGGSYSKKWYQGKSIKHNGSVARVDTENGFYIIAETGITGYSSDKASLGGVVKLEKAGRIGGKTGITVVPTDKYSSYDDLVQAVEDSDLEMETFEVINRLKEKDYDVRSRTDVSLGKEELDAILDLDPKPLKVSEKLMRSIKNQSPDIDYREVVITDEVRSFTGADLEEYSLEVGDIVEIPLTDYNALSYGQTEKISSYDEKIKGADIDWSVSRVGKGWNLSDGKDKSINIYFNGDGDVVMSGSSIERYIDLNDVGAGGSLGLYDVGENGESLIDDISYVSIADRIESIVGTVDEDGSELSDSGRNIDSVYEEYNDLVNMPPSEIEDRMDNMNCVHKASGDDAVEHLKRNKFIQETNKSEWGSKKVPEEFANESARSRKIVDQAVRTVSFGKRHLAQLEDENITRMEDGCFNPRVEGLKNWAIDPLRMNGFSVDEDKFEKEHKVSEMSDVGYSVKNDSGSLSDHVDTLSDDSTRISSFSDAESYFMDMDFDDMGEEFFVAVAVDSSGRELDSKIVAEGDNNSVDFDNSDIVDFAEGNNSDKVLVAHNHPSGNSSPSEDDVNATLRLESDLRDSGIDLIDHLVLADGEVSSMKSKGIL